MRDLWKLAGLLCVVTLLSACSGDSFVASATSPPTNQNCVADPTLPECLVSAQLITLGATKFTVESDNADIAVITATVVDENNVALKGAQVTFSSPVGQGTLFPSPSIIATDENGKASINFKSGDNPSNRTVTITASVAGIGSATLGIDIIGTTLETTTTTTSLQVPVGSTNVTQPIKVTAKNAGGQPIRNVPLTFTVVTTGSAVVSASSLQGTTDNSGEVNLTLTASGTGTATFVASGLNATPSTTLFTVANIAVDNPFRITAPTTDPSALTADGVSTLTVTVAAQGVATVRFTTTIGEWVGAGGLPYFDVAVAAGVATATLQAAVGDQGFATVSAFNTSDYSIFDSMNVAMSPPISAAAVMILQSDVKTLPQKTGTTSYSTTVRAQVKTDDASGNYPIYNVPVVLSLANSTGGGETLSKGYATTDLNGFVIATFTSGITPTGQSGVQITATVAGAPGISDSITVEIGGLAASVALGTPRVIEQIDTNDSINIYNMSALVADGTGTAVAGAQVTLHFWPASYLTGVWYDDDTDFDTEDWRVYYTGVFNNEDIDEDTILDPGEDVNGDGELTPANSTAGAGPSAVTTLADGAAPFNFTYLKDFAEWVLVRAKGTTRVLGTEATTTTYFTPSSLKSEVDQGLVHDSPFRLILEASLTGPNALIAMYPGTSNPWQVQYLSGTPAVTDASPTPGSMSGRSYLIPAGATAGTTLAVLMRVVDNGNTDRFVDFTMFVNVIP